MNEIIDDESRQKVETWFRESAETFKIMFNDDDCNDETTTIKLVG